MARIRLPLQLGLAGLGQSVRFAATVWLGPLLLILSPIPMSGHGGGVLGFLVTMVMALASIAIMAYSSWALDVARRDRPTDAVLGPGGFTVEGRAGGDQEVTWAQVTDGLCVVIDGEPRRSPGWSLLSWLTLGQIAPIARRARVQVRRLVLTRGSQDDLVLAEAAGASEIESLERLYDALGAAGAPTGEERAASLPPEILRCPSCDAPAAPTNQPSVPCRFCGADIPIPESLRERQRAAAELEGSGTSRARTVRRVLDQPGADRAARLVGAGRLFMMWCQPLALIALVVFVVHHTGDAAYAEGARVLRVEPSNDAVFVYDLALFAFTVTAIFTVVWSGLSAYLANRRALRLLCEHFGAVPPATSNAPATCRECGAPLPDPAGALLVRCVYCSAENVLGIDPRPAALRRRSEKVDLDAALRHRRRARLRLLVTVPLCLLVVAGMSRELGRAWWIPRSVIRIAGRVPELSCTMNPCGTITNHDLLSRTVVVSRGPQTRRATLLPGGAIWWSCPEDGHIQAGGRTLNIRDLGDRSTLSIDHGTLAR